MKITSVEALSLRQPEVKYQCDSGQDALIVRVETDAGITGIGEVDSSPMAVKGAIELAALPRQIRGFGHVKQAALARVSAKQAALLGRFQAGPSHALAAE